MFGGFDKKLKRWEEAGITMPDQTQRILAFEGERKSGKLSRDLTNVGILAIFLGVLSVIGANWQDIPPFGKIGLHILLNLGVILGILKLDPARHPYGRDACVAALFGLFLTFIALIAQIYNLHGPLFKTMIFWLSICTPFIWYWGRTYTAILPWLCVALFTLFLSIGEFIPNKMEDLVIPLIFFYLPIVLLLVARAPWFGARRPGFVQSFRTVGLLLPGLYASLAVGLFFIPSQYRVLDHHQELVIGLVAGLFAIFTLFHPLKSNDPRKFDLWIYLLVSGIFVTLPLVLPGVVSSVLSAVLFVLYWIYLAWLGARIHSQNLTDWAIRIVMLRLVFFYIEIFGDLMRNGFGLILSGVLLLILIKNRAKIMNFGRKLVRYEF